METEYGENRILQLMKAEKDETILYVCETDVKDEEYDIFCEDVRYWALVENRYQKGGRGDFESVIEIFNTILPVTLVDNEYMEVGSCENQKVCLINWANERDIINKSLKSDPNWKKARERLLKVKYKKEIEYVFRAMMEQRQIRHEQAIEKAKDGNKKQEELKKALKGEGGKE